MSIALRRNTGERNTQKDPLHGFRIVFDVILYPNNDGLFENRDEAARFMHDFCDAVGNKNACYYSGYSDTTGNPKHLYVMVGYAQKFQDEFKAKFG